MNHLLRKVVFINKQSGSLDVCHHREMGLMLIWSRALRANSGTEERETRKRRKDTEVEDTCRHGYDSNNGNDDSCYPANYEKTQGYQAHSTTTRNHRPAVEAITSIKPMPFPLLFAYISVQAYYLRYGNLRYRHRTIVDAYCPTSIH